jgi:hypothetical protein
MASFRGGASLGTGFMQGLQPFIEMSIKQKLQKQQQDMQNEAMRQQQEMRNRSDVGGLTPISPQQETERQFNPMSNTPVPDMVKRVGGTAYGVTPPKLGGFGSPVQMITHDPITGKYLNSVTGEEITTPTVPKGTIVRSKNVDLGYVQDRAVAAAKGAAEGKASVKTPLPAETAGKLTLVTQGIKDIDEAKKIIFKPDGTLNDNAVLGMNMPGGGFGEEGRMAYSKIYNAIEGKLRAETGAAAPDSEVKRIVDRFRPRTQLAGGFGDTAKSAADKMDRLREFLENTRVGIDPQGKYSYQEGAAPAVGKAPSVGGTFNGQVIKKVTQIQ